MAEKKTRTPTTRTYTYNGESRAYIPDLGVWVEPGDTVETDTPLVNGQLERKEKP